MRIVQVAASVASADGGPTTGVLGLNSAYNHRPGTSAVAVVTDADGAIGRLTRAERQKLAERPDTQISVLPRSRPHRLKNSWQLRRAVNRSVAGADLVHVHGVYLAHTIWAWRAARRHGVPFIVQPHGALEPYQARQGRLHKRVWDVVVGRRILSDAAALVAASDAEAANLHSTCPGVQVLVTPLGVSEAASRITDEQRERVSRWLAAPRYQRVLFLGRLARKKRPDLLLHAWNHLDAGALAIVGPEDEWRIDDLKAITSPDRADSVDFVGHAAPEAARWFMQNAGIFVLPSENENFGIAVAEAMAAGTCVVTTPETAAGEHVNRARSGVVYSVDTPHALANILVDLLRDPDRVSELGLHGETYSRANLTWGATSDTLLRALAQHGLLTRRDAGASSCASAS